MEQIAQKEGGGIRIHCVPKHRIAATLRNPDACALLARGMAAARHDDARPTVMQMLVGDKQLWLVFGEDSATPLALWTTTICGDENGNWWLGVGELAGRQVRRWAGLMSDRMAEFARSEGCTRVVFFGRRGWRRLARQVREIGEHGGIYVFERSV